MTPSLWAGKGGYVVGIFLAIADLSRSKLSDADATEIIADLEALALIEAPCIEDQTFTGHAAVKAILRQAALRWARAGEGGITASNLSSGPFGMSNTFDTRVSGEGRLWPSEVRQLQKLCKLHSGSGRGGRKAFTILPGRGLAPWM